MRITKVGQLKWLLDPVQDVEMFRTLVEYFELPLDEAAAMEESVHADLLERDHRLMEQDAAEQHLDAMAARSGNVEF